MCANNCINCLRQLSRRFIHAFHNILNTANLESEFSFDLEFVFLVRLYKNVELNLYTIYIANRKGIAFLNI